MGRLLYTGGHKQGLRWIRKLRTWPGRLIGDDRRKIAGNLALEAAFEIALERADWILGQHMPAPVAVRFKPDLKAKHSQLRAAGKPAKVAIVAIMRKLLETANALVKADRFWIEKSPCV